MDYRKYITIDPDKRGGKPCVRGLRITVYEVLEYLASDMSEEQILADFPDLTHEDLKACIAFAADRERKLNDGPGGVKLLFDQNLSHTLVVRLADLFPGSIHVRDVGLQAAADHVVGSMPGATI